MTSIIFRLGLALLGLVLILLLFSQPVSESLLTAVGISQSSNMQEVLSDVCKGIPANNAATDESERENRIQKIAIASNSSADQSINYLVNKFSNDLDYQSCNTDEANPCRFSRDLKTTVFVACIEELIPDEKIKCGPYKEIGRGLGDMVPLHTFKVRISIFKAKTAEKIDEKTFSSDRACPQRVEKGLEADDIISVNYYLEIKPWFFKYTDDPA